METRTITDDITGLPLAGPAKIKIMIGDATGELDLSPESLAALTALASGSGSSALAELLALPFSAAPARSSRASARGGKRSGESKPISGTSASADEIREWAKGSGHAVNERGRVPKNVIAAFIAANAGKSAPSPLPVDAGAQSDAKPDAGATTDASAKTASKPATGK